MKELKRLPKSEWMTSRESLYETSINGARHYLKIVSGSERFKRHWYAMPCGDTGCYIDGISEHFFAPTKAQAIRKALNHLKAT